MPKIPRTFGPRSVENRNDQGWRPNWWRRLQRSDTSCSRAFRRLLGALRRGRCTRVTPATRCAAARQAGSSNLRGDIASITPFIRETRRMERRAVEVTVGESTRRSFARVRHHPPARRNRAPRGFCSQRVPFYWSYIFTLNEISMHHLRNYGATSSRWVKQ